MKQTGERETFVVRILNTQNATWQGTVTWTDGKRMESFRSALELIRLIDSTLQEKSVVPVLGVRHGIRTAADGGVRSGQ